MLKKLTLALFLLSLCAGHMAFAQEGCPNPPEHVEATPGPPPVLGPKVWDAGTAIGVVLDPDGTQATDENGNPKFDGRMTGPQDQTQPQDQWKTPTVKVGKTLNCGVESASDFDHWTKDDGDGDDCTKGPEGYSGDGVTYTWSGAGTFEDIHSAGTTWTAPSTPGRYTLTCTMDDTPSPVNAPETGSRDDGAISVSCVVSVYKLSVQFVEDEVAAGAIGNPGHQSGFNVIASDGQGGVPNVTVEAPEVTSGGLGPYEDITASVSMDNATTDSNGKAHGTFTSGHRIQKTTISVYNQSKDDKSSDGIEQVWNSESDAWSYEPYFDFDVNTPITYKMSYSRGPISGHSLQFFNTSISGYEWDPTLGEDWDGDGVPDGDYAYRTYSEDDDISAGWDQYEGLSQWGNTSEGDAGEYTANQTVGWDWDFIVDDVKFDMTDNTVYYDGGA